MSYPSINTSYAQTKYNLTKCVNRRTNKTLKYIVIHYTATDASAKNNCKYFSGGNRNASADFFIDKDGSIYKFNKNIDLYYSWHCGDGKGKYGITNANSIGIELVSSGAEYTQAQKNSLRSLVRVLMADYGISASRVVRHYDASRKLCPAPYCGTTTKNARWKALHDYITGYNVSSSTFKRYVVIVDTPVLNIRKGAGTNYAVCGTVKKGEAFTIVAEANGAGASKWGKLLSGAGWISLDFCKRK